MAGWRYGRCSGPNQGGVDELERQHPWSLGSRVQLRQRLPYLKTADPMPMLRPADLVDLEEVGEVVGLRAQSLVAVRFRRGAFLIDAAALQEAASD